MTIHRLIPSVAASAGLIVVALGLVGVQVAGASPLYQVNVTRVADNLYKDSTSGAYIETQQCLEQAYNEPGSLDYPGPMTQGTLYFNQSGQQCNVLGVLQGAAPAPLTHDQQIIAAAQSMGWLPPIGANDPEQNLSSARSFIQMQQNICALQVGAPVVDGQPQWDKVQWANVPFSVQQACCAALSVTL